MHGSGRQMEAKNDEEDLKGNSIREVLGGMRFLNGGADGKLEAWLGGSDNAAMNACMQESCPPKVLSYCSRVGS